MHRLPVWNHGGGDFKIATSVYRSLSGTASAYLATDCHLKKVVVSCVLPILGLVLSGGPTATLGTDVSLLPAQGCGTAFQLVLSKCTSAMNSLSGC